ncbi:MAG TPA: hypothetical protein PLE54_08600 [Burkholderiaceae bacterium]|nr:hypothetical protein [Burkholderiaceae bacterium]
MKGRDKKDYRGPPTGTRTGPRARAAQEQTYGNPYQRADRPSRGAPPRERLQVAAGGTIRLDPDVARVFRDSEAVNEALRLVIRLARFGGGRPSGPPRDRAPSFRERRGPPAHAERGERPPPRRPRFEE